METTLFNHILGTSSAILLVSGGVAVLSFLATMVLFSYSANKPNSGFLFLFVKNSTFALLKNALTIITLIALFVFIMNMFFV